MKIYILLFITAILLISPVLAEDAGLTSIKQSDIRTDIEFLASAELEGREAGTKGAEVTAQFIASNFKGLGLISPEGADDYYQMVPLVSMRPDWDNTSITIERKDGAFTLQAEKDFYYYPQKGDDFDLTAGMVFCGYGITAPEYDYDDYAGVDVTGKIIIAMTGEPNEKDENSVFNGTHMTKYSMVPVKVRLAEEHGAKALILVNPPAEDVKPMEGHVARYKERSKKPVIQQIGKTDAMPVFYFTDKSAAEILSGSVDLEKIFDKIEKKGAVKPIEIKNTSASLSIRFKDRNEFESPNVVGYLEGSDPVMKEKLVIIGAHYDHEGINDGKVYFGADDNASGVAGLLELAEAFATSPVKPKRSILFISFAAEEKGLHGSEYYASHPLYPLENSVAMINMDEIGRNGASSYRGMHSPTLEEDGKNYLMIMYSAQCPELEKINNEVNEKYKLDIDFDPNLVFHSPSDHVSFHVKDIPSMFYFTGFHPDYTSPRDTPDKINYEKMERIVRLIYSVAYDIADAENDLLFDNTIKTVDKKKRMEF